MKSATEPVWSTRNRPIGGRGRSGGLEGIRHLLQAGRPFTPEDATGGIENELQAVVAGSRQTVDLPTIIESSLHYQNMLKRHQRGEIPWRVIADLQRWLAENKSQVWENSWVHFPARRLTPLAAGTLEHDLLADKGNPGHGRRGDVDKFITGSANDPELRLPVSYLLKLALVDLAGSEPGWPAWLRTSVLKWAECYLCDNTSPENHSFHLVRADEKRGLGQAAAEETARRYLLTQILAEYANLAFGLVASDQRVLVYYAPHPPVRQKALAGCLSDSFYRDLFMNPCLSGWTRGEAKHRYMHLCHQVLSRAQITALGRLRDAGIINHDLVLLPSMSNISLANNGTHVSLGSQALGRLLSQASPMTDEHEKQLGDLVIKYVEHFLPLFVGLYSAAPYRLGFLDFHPEKILSFLPYELDYTHLRMIWRRWRKKAHLKVQPFGFRLTPFGPQWLDRLLCKVPGLRGDEVPDYRLLDYLAAVMSTDQSPALDGRLGNQERLKQDLAQMGVFDPQMPIYLLYRQRAWATMGYSGFEGRHYSLFGSLTGDLAPAVDLQNLITALAVKQISEGRLRPAHIPDHPEVESERRQVFFGAAIGLPTFFARADTRNLVMRSILEETGEVRPSRRYAGYLRVKHSRYRQALLGILRREAADLTDHPGWGAALDDLERRLNHPEELSVYHRLNRDILREIGAKSALTVEADEFNQAAESHYREGLREKHVAEAWSILETDMANMPHDPLMADPEFRDTWRRFVGDADPQGWAAAARPRLLAGTLDRPSIQRLGTWVLLTIYRAAQHFAGIEATPNQFGDEGHAFDRASIH